MKGVEALQSRLAEVRREIVGTSERLQRLRDEEYGLSLSLARMTGSPVPRAAEAGSNQTAPAGGRIRITPAVRALLAETPSPLTRTEIVYKLAEDGIATSPDTVSASLSYLRKHGVASNTGGRWHMTREPTDGDDYSAPSGPLHW